MKKIINGIQQIGIGVKDVKAVFNWYRAYLGFDILLFKDEATADLMTQYTDGEVRQRIAFLALNMIGGGGLEIWQFKDRTPKPPKNEIVIGDLGIQIMKLRSKDVQASYKTLKAQDLPLLTEIEKTQVSTHFFFQDPWNNLVQVIADDYCYDESKSDSGGVMGAVLGVSDMSTSIRFYKELLGFDSVVFDETNVFKDINMLQGGKENYRRVLLRRSDEEIGGFGELLGPCEIELIQALDRKPKKIYKDRLWGDLGYIHLCFDVSGMDDHRNDAKSIGHPFTVDSADSFDMGDAAGHFSYVEDPDGTLLEFVETHKVPILKKLGIFINMKKRSPLKPLPRWVVKAMKVHRVKKNL